MSNKYIKSIKPAKYANGIQITFRTSKMDSSLVNAIRRTLLAEIPTYSLGGNPTKPDNHHQILSNTSHVFKNNEYLIDRMAQIPIFVKDPLKPPNGDHHYCICALGDQTNPLINQSDLDLEVTAHQLQVFDPQTGNQITQPKIQDIIPYDFPILKLRKGEEFHYQGQVVKGVGWYHASFQGARVTFKWENTNSIKNPNPPKSQLNPVTDQPMETLKTKQTVPKDNWGNPEEITLTIKPVGHYDANTCLHLALETLIDKLLLLQNLVDNPKGYNDTKIEIIPHPKIDNYIQIKIHDTTKTLQFLASHTLGNLLHNHMYYRLHHLIKGDPTRIRESLISYRQPHPLDRIIYLDIKTPDNLYPSSIPTSPMLHLFNETVDDLIDTLTSLKKSLQTSSKKI